MCDVATSKNDTNQSTKQESCIKEGGGGLGHPTNVSGERNEDVVIFVM